MQGSSENIPFTLPSFAVRPRWQVIFGTIAEDRAGRTYPGEDVPPLADHSLALFRLAHGQERHSS
jgi:hypothetical protein